MLLEADCAQMEWRCAAFLSQDPVMLEEILSGKDQHQATCTEFFKDPSGKLRTQAKIFNFRMIYGTTAYGLAMDSTMPRFSAQKFQGIINAFFDKYKRLGEWQSENIKKVIRTGCLRTPTGRILKFRRIQKTDGSKVYHEPHIKNYPVQSFAFDLVCLAMVPIWKRVRKAGLQAKIIMQVHDSMLFDLPKEEVKPLVDLISGVFSEYPRLCEQHFKFKLNIPMDVDVKVGETWGDMNKYNGAL